MGFDFSGIQDLATNIQMLAISILVSIWVIALGIGVVTVWFYKKFKK